MSRISHIAAPVAVLLLASLASAQRSDRVVVLAEPTPDHALTAHLARALRPHLASSDVTLRVVRAAPPTGDDLLRAAWGAEVAARERADAVLWLEAADDGGLTLRVADARARVRKVEAPPGDRFDQVRTVALAARSHVTRMVDRARRERGPGAEEDDPAVPGPTPAAPDRRLGVAPVGALALSFHASGDGLAAGTRLEGGLRLGRLLELRAGGAILLPEDVEAADAGAAGTRLRVPVGLLVAGVLPVDGLELSAGLEGLVSVAFLETREGAARTRVAPLLGLRLSVRRRVGSAVFLEIPLSFRLRIAAPGSDGTWTEAAVAPGLEGTLAVSLGVGG